KQMNNTTGDEEEQNVESLCLKIKANLEDLFSDGHLAEDGFLLKHVQKNKQGYVSLKLLTCLKKIKDLSTNWHMTLAAAQLSNLLQVNEERTKVRRIEPLPSWLLCSPSSKLLLVWNIGEEGGREDGVAQGLQQRSLSERILQKFNAHGGVASVWILPPGKELPKELRCYSKRHKELGKHLCAVVKFDSLAVVRNIYGTLKAEEHKSNGKGVCVVPLGFQSTHHISQDRSVDTPSVKKPPGPSEDPVQRAPSPADKVSEETPDSCHFDLACDSPSFSRLSLRHSRMSWCSGDSAASGVPWVLRRKCAAGALHREAQGLPKAPGLMQRVLRQPLGPDGTRGFQSRLRRLLQIKERRNRWRSSTSAE
uniref:La-related protein 6-like n=1 Tax=Echeneis naucrates TaxID=173247 RepID=A0A665TPZ7_ECHNA